MKVIKKMTKRRYLYSEMSISSRGIYYIILYYIILYYVFLCLYIYVSDRMVLFY